MIVWHLHEEPLSAHVIQEPENINISGIEASCSLVTKQRKWAELGEQVHYSLGETCFRSDLGSKS